MTYDHDHVSPSAHRTTVVEEPVHRDTVVVDEGPSGATTLRRVVMLLFGILQALLVLRIVLQLLGANTGNEIVALVLGITEPFVAPFAGMFDVDRAGSGESTLDVVAIIALVGWTLVEALVLAVVGLLDRRRVVA
jgi:hypothetical protein